MGVQEMTRFGMTGKDFDVVAGLIADCVIRNRRVKDDVAAFRRKFSEMKYCLPTAEAVPLAARVFAAAMPASTSAGRSPRPSGAFLRPSLREGAER